MYLTPILRRVCIFVYPFVRITYTLSEFGCGVFFAGVVGLGVLVHSNANRFCTAKTACWTLDLKVSTTATQITNRQIVWPNWQRKAV